MIGLVDKNHRAWRSFCHQLANIAFRRDARRGIVGIADIDQAFLRRIEHLRNIVTESFRQRDLNHFSPVYARVIQDRFEGRIRDDHFSAARHEGGHDASARARR